MVSYVVYDNSGRTETIEKKSRMAVLISKIETFLI